MKSSPIAFHRIGAEDNVDAFEVLTMDGVAWDIIFLSPYYPRKSRLAPSGYDFNPDRYQRRLFRGTNGLVLDFPEGIYQAAFDCSKQLVGFPVVDNALKDFGRSRWHARGQHHHDRLKQLRSARPHAAQTGGGDRSDALRKLLWHFYIELREFIQRVARDNDIKLGEQYGREFLYLVLYAFTALLFKGRVASAASISDRLSESVLAEHAEAADEPMKFLVEQYRSRFARYREIDILFTSDEFLKREGALILGENLAGYPSMILGTIAISSVSPALEVISDAIAKLRL